MFIAHRGAKTNTKQENTIPAFLNAINNDLYAGFELDIRVSKDKKIVVCHDPFVDGLLISNTNYNKLKKYHIPLLEDVLKLKNPKIILIEIKDFNMDLDLLCNILNKYQDKDIYIMSFSKKPIHKLRNKNVPYKLGILNFILNSDSNYKEYDFIVLLRFTLTKELITYFKKESIKVFVYGVGKKIDILDKDVYYIIDN